MATIKCNSTGLVSLSLKEIESIFKALKLNEEQEKVILKLRSENDDIELSELLKEFSTSKLLKSLLAIDKFLSNRFFAIKDQIADLVDVYRVTTAKIYYPGELKELVILLSKIDELFEIVYNNDLFEKLIDNEIILVKTNGLIGSEEFEQFEIDSKLLKMYADALKKEKNINRELEESKNKVIEVIRHFTHDLGNTLAPGLIFEVAKRILKQDIITKEAYPALIRAYSSELMVKNHSNLVKLKLSEDEGFRKALESEKNNTIDLRESILNLFHTALERTIAYILFTNVGLYKSVIKEVFLPERDNIEIIQKSFIDEVFFEEQTEMSVFDWMAKHSAKIVFEYSPIWKDITTIKMGYLSTFISESIKEIFLNSFKYLQYNHHELFRITLDEETTNNASYLTICVSNKAHIGSITNSYGGLSMLKEDLKRLNSVVNSQQEYLFYEISKGVFQAKLLLNKSLFI